MPGTATVELMKRRHGCLRGGRLNNRVKVYVRTPAKMTRQHNALKELT
jgi:hypothetical protein